MNSARRVLSVLFVLFVVSLAAPAASIYGPTVFYGDVSLGSWRAPTGITAAATSNGTYTNGTWTNYYRLSGTNKLGRIPDSTNVVVVFAGGAGTNAVALSWRQAPGVDAHIVLRSLDAGVTWTNWLSLGPTVTNWTDTGTNAWQTTSFTGTVSLAPAPVVPWIPADTSKDYATAAALLAVSGRVDVVETGKVGMAAFNASNDAHHAAAINALAAGTNAQARVGIVETGKLDVAVFETNAAAVYVQVTNALDLAQQATGGVAQLNLNAPGTWQGFGTNAFVSSGLPLIIVGGGDGGTYRIDADTIVTNSSRRIKVADRFEQNDVLLAWRLANLAAEGELQLVGHFTEDGIAPFSYYPDRSTNVTDRSSYLANYSGGGLVVTSMYWIGNYSNPDAGGTTRIQEGTLNGQPTYYGEPMNLIERAYVWWDGVSWIFSPVLGSKETWYYVSPSSQLSDVDYWTAGGTASGSPLMAEALTGEAVASSDAGTFTTTNCQSAYVASVVRLQLEAKAVDGQDLGVCMTGFVSRCDGAVWNQLEMSFVGPSTNADLQVWYGVSIVTNQPSDTNLIARITTSADRFELRKWDIGYAP